VILVDVKLLVDATMTSARDHDAARSWLQNQLGGTARVGLPWRRSPDSYVWSDNPEPGSDRFPSAEP